MWATFKIDLRTNVWYAFWNTQPNATTGTNTAAGTAIPAAQGFYNIQTNYRLITSGDVTLAQSGYTFDTGSAIVYGVK